MTITASEQYLIEVINRARLDPAAEAARYGVALNDGLPTTTGYGAISTTAKQVLAPIGDLDISTTGHSNWMLSTGSFSHTGAGGSDHTARIRDAGYDFAGAWHLGENLATVPTSRGLAEGLMDWHEDALINSAAHRSNMLDDSYREIGVAEVHTGSQSYVTENFGYQSTRLYVTGVAYNDADHDHFYSVGEGRANLRFAVTGGKTTQTADAGGYALTASKVSALAVEVGSGSAVSKVVLDLNHGNVKLDVANGNMLLTSGHLTLVSGIADATLLGISNLHLSGSSADNGLYGNAGANILAGGAGNDSAWGGLGNDTLRGGSGADSLSGNLGADLMNGNLGADRMYGNTGKDILYGDEGKDVLFGNADNDRLNGGDDNDLLFGGTGDDVLAGNAGSDSLTGDAGADTFIFAKGCGHDVVVDFSGSQTDHLRFGKSLWGGASLSDAQIISRYADVVNGHVVFDFGTDELTLKNVASLSGLASHIDVF